MNNKLTVFKVLVIDDDQFMLDLTRMLLSHMGIHDIKLVSSGSSGLTFLAHCQQQPDVIMCDLQMPDMDGIEVINELSKLEYKGNLILFSGEDKRIIKTAESIATAYGLHVAGTLQKPVNFQDIQSTFEQIKRFQPRQNRSNWPSFTEHQLEEAIAKQQLIPYFQPKVNIATGQIMGAEVLARWLHPNKGLIPPLAFIPLAEQSGLIDDLTLHMFSQATRLGGQWFRQGHDLQLAVNISMKNLSRSDFPELLLAIARENNLPISNIILEVTESSLMQNFALSLQNLTRLRLKGIALSIDDFGTGYSSMEMLKLIPFSELKIDRSFVHEAQHDSTALAILEASVSLAKKLGMNLIAEGIENQADWDRVAELCCDQGQGYWIGKPMSADEFMRWTENWNRNPPAKQVQDSSE